jgi:phage terminase large subunit-like protein
VRDKVDYVGWIRDGCIGPPMGTSRTTTMIRRDINELAKQYNIRQVGIDRWNAIQLATQLQGDGVKS